MIIPDIYSDRKTPSYKSYKAQQFNKKKEKARGLINSVVDTSLKPEDKINLLVEITRMIEESWQYPTSKIKL